MNIIDAEMDFFGAYRIIEAYSRCWLTHLLLGGAYLLKNLWNFRIVFKPNYGNAQLSHQLLIEQMMPLQESFSALHIFYHCILIFVIAESLSS